MYVVCTCVWDETPSYLHQEGGRARYQQSLIMSAWLDASIPPGRRTRSSKPTDSSKLSVVSIYDTGLHALMCDSLCGPLDIVRLPSRRVRWFGGSACVCRADS